MGLFSKKSRTSCEMCGKAEDEGCGNAGNHVEEIRGDSPPWLPATLRAQAQGEFTWLCLHCNAYPALKWPRQGGAVSGMLIHLGTAHHAGQLAGMPRGMANFDMIPSGELP